MNRLPCLRIVGALLFLAAMTAGCPPAPKARWILSLDGPEYGALMDAVIDGTTILAVGTTNHLHMPPYEGDLLLIRTNAHGEILWEQTWGGDGYEQAWAVTKAPKGEFFVLGETDSHGSGDRDFLLLRVDAAGEELWWKTYGTPLREWPFGMLALANGDLFLYGRTVGAETGTEDRYAVRVTPDGEIVWTYDVPRPEGEIILDALETETGDLVLCVSSAEDPMLVKLSGDGGMVWEKRHELPGWQFGSAIAAATDGEMLLAGFQMAPEEPRQADVWLARSTADGDLLWQRSFGRPGEDDYAQSLLRLPDESYLIGGLGNGMPLFKIDGDGTVIWERRLSDGAVHATNSLVETGDGGVILSGAKQLEPGRSYDALLVKVDRDGRAEP